MLSGFCVDKVFFKGEMVEEVGVILESIQGVLLRVKMVSLRE